MNCTGEDSFCVPQQRIWGLTELHVLYSHPNNSGDFYVFEL